MNKIFFGKLKNNKEIHKYILKNSVATLTLMDFGAAIVSFEVFGKDIVGGYDNLNDYLVDDSHQGATIGRVANRIANAEFTMDSVVYRLPKNDGENCLHGGDGFDRLSVGEGSVVNCNSTSISHIESIELDVDAVLNLTGATNYNVKVNVTGISDLATDVAGAKAMVFENVSSAGAKQFIVLVIDFQV